MTALDKQFRESRGHRWDPRVHHVHVAVTMSPDEIRSQLRKLERLQLWMLFTGGPVVPPVSIVEANGGLWILPERGPDHDLPVLHRMKVAGWPDVEHLRIDIEPFGNGLWDCDFDNAATVTLSTMQVRPQQVPGGSLEESLNVVASSFVDRFKVLAEDVIE